MALTKADVLMWREIAPLVPTAPRVLEIGQANWYGDVQPDAVDTPPGGNWRDGDGPFVTARNFYSRMMPESSFASVDKHGPDGEAIDLDLNKVGVLRRLNSFNVVINTGTGEHVFDQENLFRSMHDACSYLGFDCRGLMIHAAPMSGWFQHGFYNYHPTFWSDLAAANGYEIVYLSQFNLTFGRVDRLQSLSQAHPQQGDSMLYLVFRKTKDAPFCVPMQGRYKGAEAIPDPR
jgi:hypothetical protein